MVSDNGTRYGESPPRRDGNAVYHSSFENHGQRAEAFPGHATGLRGDGYRPLGYPLIRLDVGTLYDRAKALVIILNQEYV